MKDRTLVERPKQYKYMSEEDRWKKARYRFSVIAPVIRNKNPVSVPDRAEQTGVSRTSIYKWRKKFKANPKLEILRPPKIIGAINPQYLKEEIEILLRDTIKEIYKPGVHGSTLETIKEVQARCKAKKLKSPHHNTIRRRISEMVGKYSKTKPEKAD